jgi:hypothetical protein
MNTGSQNTGNHSTELVQLCLNGDQGAWASLVEEYRGLVYSIWAATTRLAAN